VEVGIVVKVPKLKFVAVVFCHIDGVGALTGCCNRRADENPGCTPKPLSTESTKLTDGM
jgi:hypothetical protein